MFNPTAGANAPKQLQIKPSWLLILLSLLLVGSTGTYLVSHLKAARSSEPDPLMQVAQVTTVTALGWLEPAGEVVRISATSTPEGNRIDQLLVQEGDTIKPGEVIAILDSRDRLQAALAQAEEQVKVAEARLQQVQAGAKQGEIAAQAATLERLQVERETKIAAQTARIARIEAERRTSIDVQTAKIARLEAERRTSIEAQTARIGRIEVEHTEQLKAQQAAIARLTAELENAEVEDHRHQELYQQGVISASQRDSKGLTRQAAQKRLLEAQATLSEIDASKTQQLREAQATLEQIRTSYAEQLNEAQATLNQIIATNTEQLNEEQAILTQIILGQQEQLKEATATLDRIQEVRPVDVQIAQAEVRAAEVAVEQAKANLAQAYIRTPQGGQVIKIHSWPGEVVSNNGILDLGETRQMYAVAEVYESDLQQVKIGQPAIITSNAFAGELHGTVERLGLQVKRQQVVNTDPSVNTDARVIEVRVKLDPESSTQVAGLTNLQVDVAIQLR